MADDSELQDENTRQRGGIGMTRIAAQDQRAERLVKFANRRSAIEAAATSLGIGATTKRITEVAQELLAWIENE